jgi:hypothetical protein
MGAGNRQATEGVISQKSLSVNYCGESNATQSDALYYTPLPVGIDERVEGQYFHSKVCQLSASLK